jgi:hypothetical protein
MTPAEQLVGHVTITITSFLGSLELEIKTPWSAPKYNLGA